MTPSVEYVEEMLRLQIREQALTENWLWVAEANVAQQLATIQPAAEAMPDLLCIREIVGQLEAEHQEILDELERRQNASCTI